LVTTQPPHRGITLIKMNPKNYPRIRQLFWLAYFALVTAFFICLLTNCQPTPPEQLTNEQINNHLNALLIKEPVYMRGDIVRGKKYYIFAYSTATIEINGNSYYIRIKGVPVKCTHIDKKVIEKIELLKKKL